MRYVIICLGFLTAALLVNGHSAFVSIDCGYSGDPVYFDPKTTVQYDPDAKYIDSGANHDIDPNYTTGQPKQTWNLRSFPVGLRNCYTIPNVTQGYKYLIRASFLYGNYDGHNSTSLTFDLHIGVNLWQTMNITNASELYTGEIITLASSNYFSICLVKTGDSIPFISALELRPIDRVYKDVNQTVSLRLLVRKNMGSDQTIRYPDDKQDRIWGAEFVPNCLNRGCESRPNLDSITTNAPVKVSPDDPYEVPLVVMQSAIAEDNITQMMSLSEADNGFIDPTDYYYIYLHFAELDKHNGSRIFQVRLMPDGQPNFDNITPDYLVASHIRLVYQPGADRNTYLSLTRVPGSTLAPLLNAMEAYSYVNLTSIATDSQDVEGMMSIKQSENTSSTSSWQGDPCAPRKFTWNEIKCTFSSSAPPRVTSLNLSYFGLRGTIPTAIAKLTAIESLDLSKNSFTGSIPNFLATLNSLQILDLSYNLLNGSTPTALCDKQAKGLLQLRLDNNPCDSEGTCVCFKQKQEQKPKHTTHHRILVISVVAVTPVIALILLSIFFLKRRVSKKRPLMLKSKWRHIEGSSFHTESPRFTYQDLRTITNNFERIIGKGGFGTVYYGRLHDGTEVAVKMSRRLLAIEEGIADELRAEELCLDSHGMKEFLIEAQLLSRVHHRNLVSLVGYCKDGYSLGLVFEYAAQGSLRDHLSDKAGTGKVLSWRERLHIAVDAAQGLEYLHKGCKPPIIHRDVKTSNILLSHNLEAKIADFGLSKAFLTDAQTHVSTEAVVGTPGYVDPEYHSTYRLTEKSDVYSFGIVLLELVTALPAVLKPSSAVGHILQWVREGLAQGNTVDVVDPRLRRQQYDIHSVSKVIDLAIGCTALDARERPPMPDVVMQLKASLQLEIAHHGSATAYGGAFDVNQSGTSEITSMSITELSGPSAR